MVVNEKPPINLIAEIGINHNGALDSALSMIRRAKEVGFDYVKFQKRNPDVCVPENQKKKKKSVPWEEKPITYLQYKKDIELSEENYIRIDNYCHDIGIKWFASVWDLDSVDFMIKFGGDLVKIPSAHLTNHELILKCKEHFKTVMVSTGMSTQVEIDEMYKATKPKILMHTNACYPTELTDVNLGYMGKLFSLSRYMKKDQLHIGYSNHCMSPLALYYAADYHIRWMETHVTMDNKSWGSDQAASFELKTMGPIIKNIRDIEKYGDIMNEGYGNRPIYPGEKVKRKSLRGV